MYVFFISVQKKQRKSYAIQNIFITLSLVSSGYCLYSNVFDKPDEQRQACLSYVMARKGARERTKKHNGRFTPFTKVPVTYKPANSLMT